MTNNKFSLDSKILYRSTDSNIGNQGLPGSPVVKTSSL